MSRVPGPSGVCSRSLLLDAARSETMHVRDVGVPARAGVGVELDWVYGANDKRRAAA